MRGDLGEERGLSGTESDCFETSRACAASDNVQIAKYTLQCKPSKRTRYELVTSSLAAVISASVFVKPSSILVKDHGRCCVKTVANPLQNGFQLTANRRANEYG